MKKLLLALASVLAIVAGCAKENLSGNIKSHSGIKEISASLPDQTKAYLDKDGEVYKFFWYESETISVGAGTQFVTFTLSEGANTPKGKFESSEDLPESDDWFAVSPEIADASSEGETLNFSYPAELEYHAESGCAEGGEIMVSRSYDGNFAMHNAVGYIKFQVAVLENESINKIEVSGKGGRLAGAAHVIFNETQIDTVKFASTSEGGLSTLTVNFPDGPVAITPEGEPFTILIPVAPLAKGVMVTVTMASGKVATFSSSTPVQIGQIVELPVVTFDPDPVAKVGKEEFYSINQAILYANELGEDATVELLGDCNVGKDCEVLSTKVITIDLAGHTLYSVGDKFFTVASGTAGCVIIDSSEEQTGKITNTNSANSAMKVSGLTTIKSGTLISESSYGINMDGGSLFVEGGLIQGGSTGLYCKKGTDSVIDSVVVKGGSIVSTGSNAIVLNSIGATLVIYDGTVQSLKAGIYVYDGNLKIYGGFIGAKSNVVYGNRSSSYNNQIDIYGGFFHRDSTTNSIVYGHLTTDTTRVHGGYYNASPSATYVISGYEVGTCDTTVNGINFTSTIVKKADVACELKIGSGAPVQKSSVLEAFNAAKAQSEPATVTLLANCALEDSIGMWAGNVFTLDLNGYTLTTPGTKVFRVNETGAVLTIKSSKEDGMMYESSTSSNSLIVRGGGKCILESGIIKGANTSAGHVYLSKSETTGLGGEFVMNGGTIYTPSYNAVSCANGKFIMNGGTIQTDKAETYCIKVTGGSAEFNGGNFISPSRNYQVSVTTTATFNGNYENLATSGAGEIKFIGGTYTGTTRTNGSNVSIAGCTFTSDTTYAFVVTEGGKVTVGNTTFNGATKYGTIRCYGTIDLGEGVVVNGTSEDATAVYVGGDDGPGIINVAGGEYTAPKGFYAANGSLSIIDGIFNTNLKGGTVEKRANAEIAGGYFNTPKDSIIFTGSGANGICKGGWFTEKPVDSLINPAYIVDESSTTTVKGIEYKYKVIENAAAPDLISVNGTNYKTVDAAISATQTALASGNVTLKALEDCSTLTALEATGNNTLTIDLNGKVLGIPVITTTATVNITDNSVDANGKLAPADGKCPITINAGTVNFDKGSIVGSKECAVLVQGGSTKAIFNFKGGEITSDTETTGTGAANTGTLCVIDNSEMNMTGGILRSEGKSKALWCRSIAEGTYPVCNISDGTLIASKTYTFYVYTRAKVNISGGLFITNSAENSICHNGTSNSEVNITITGGYFWSAYKYTFTGYNDTSCSKYHFSGGYYPNAQVMRNTNGKKDYAFTTESGYVLTTVSETVEKVFEGTTYKFTHQVKAK